MSNLLTKNLGLRISAILIALLLWYFVTSRGQSEMSIEAAVEFKNIPAGLGMVSTSSKSVVVNVKGQERLMKNIKSANIRVAVDLAKAKMGEGTFYIGKEDIKLPYAMTVTSVSPPSIKVRLDETASRAVVVTARITGAPEHGYVVRRVSVEPPNVTVQGLKSDIGRISELKTEELDISGARETIVRNIDINTAGVNMTPEVSSVKVRIEITGRNK